MRTLHHYDDRRPGLFGYLFRLIFMLLILGGIGLVSYAYVGNFDVAPEPRSIPLDLTDQ